MSSRRGAHHRGLGSHICLLWIHARCSSPPTWFRGARCSKFSSPCAWFRLSPTNLACVTNSVCRGARHCRLASPELGPDFCMAYLVCLSMFLCRGAHLRRLGSHAVGHRAQRASSGSGAALALRESPLVYASLSSRRRDFSLSPNPCYQVKIPGISRRRCGVERATSTASLTSPRLVPVLLLPCWLRWKGCYAQRWVTAFTPSCCRWGHASCRLGYCRGATQLLLTQIAGLAHRLPSRKRMRCARPATWSFVCAPTAPIQPA
jgi:hypothetical protein